MKGGVVCLGICVVIYWELFKLRIELDFCGGSNTPLQQSGVLESVKSCCVVIGLKNRSRPITMTFTTTT